MTAAAEPAVVELVAEFDGGITWTLAGDSMLECRAHALVDGSGGVWLVDPLDADGLDELLAPLGTVRGVIVLLDRHLRQAPAVAERFGVPLHVPPGKWRSGHPRPAGSILLDDDAAGAGDAPPFRFAPLVARDGQWLEWILWWSERRVLVVPEVLGTPSYYAPRTGPAGLHPALRLMGAPDSLGPAHGALRDNIAAAPVKILVGHGDISGTHDVEHLEQPLQHPRLGLPGLAARMPMIAMRFGRARRNGARSGC